MKQIKTIFDAGVSIFLREERGGGGGGGASLCFVFRVLF